MEGKGRDQASRESEETRPGKPPGEDAAKGTKAAAGQAAGKTQEKGGEMKQRVGEGAQQAEEKGGQLKEQAGETAGQARAKAGGIAAQFKEKAGNTVDQASKKGHEYWEGETGQKVRGQAREIGDRAGDAAKRTKDTASSYAQQAREGGQQFVSEIEEEGQGEGWGGEMARRAKQAGRTIQDKATDVAQHPETQGQYAETAGKFIGAMRAQGGGIGQETEMFGHGVQMVSDTAQQTWDHVPDEAKEAMVAGSKKLAATTDRIWTKTFNLIEKALDIADRKLFYEEEDEEDQPRGGDVEIGPEPNPEETGPGGPLLRKPGLFSRKDQEQKEKERKQKEKEKEKRQSTVRIVSKVVGYVVLLLLLTIMMFFLGFFLLPILFIALLLMLIGFQCWACCVGGTC